MKKGMKDLFVDELKDMLSAEEQIVKALPKMVTAAECSKLKEAFTFHLKETKGQIQRLVKIFKLLKVVKEEKFCKATKGLIQECEEVIKEFEKSPVRDAGLICKAQRIEHYEISAYGTLRTFAKELNLYEIANLLRETENEEARADKALTKIAEGGLFTAGVNHSANIPIASKSIKTDKVKKSPLKTAVKKPVKTIAKKSVKKIAKKPVKKIAGISARN